MWPVQCKMARVALDLGVRDLAQLAAVSPNTVARLERGEEMRAQTIATLRAALENAGVLFVDEDAEGGLGVRLTKTRWETAPAQGATDSAPPALSTLGRAGRQRLSRISKGQARAESVQVVSRVRD